MQFVKILVNGTSHDVFIKAFAIISDYKKFSINNFYYLIFTNQS